MSPFLVPLTTSDIWAMIASLVIVVGVFGRMIYVELTEETQPWPEYVPPDFLYKWSREDD